MSLIINFGIFYEFRSRASDSVRALDPEERNCRFPEENEGMKILKNYTRAGCQVSNPSIQGAIP